MPTRQFPITILLSTLENGTCIAEALFFPEIIRVSDRESKVIAAVKANVKKMAEETPLLELQRRRPAGIPEIGEISLSLGPPERASKEKIAWRTPIELCFEYVGWVHGEAAAILYFPALGIEVCSQKAPTIEAARRLAPEEIRLELARRDAAESLEKLAFLQRTSGLKLVSEMIEISIPTPKQAAMQHERSLDRKGSALAEAATELVESALPIAYELEHVVQAIDEALTGRSPRSVLLVGASGVGKTAAVYELARRRAQHRIGKTPIYSTSGPQLAAGMSGFGQWQERCVRLWREAAKAGAILYLGNLIDLIEVGKSIGNPHGVADFLRPLIARGDVLAIAECTPEQTSLFERVNPRMLDAFFQIKVDEPSPERSRNILLSAALSEAPRAEVELEAVECIDLLHRRYAAYSGFPGRPIRFLKNLLQDRLQGDQADLPITSEDVTTAFSRETGLPRVLLEENHRLDLEATRTWFQSRILGQSEAIELIVDILATVKAGLTRPRKPIASLLFIGPTGVGKTEMVKSLAEFLFQDCNRVARFDMSEYADPLAVKRLIGGRADSEGLLTAKAREQPFAVVLFDEFEKADPSFFDLLLQILGDGRLTDARGRLADFSNAVVVMTSNLGAQSFERGVSGFSQGKSTREAAHRHFTRAVQGHLRPELFNRFDRIVPFAPLDESTVAMIAERELDLIRQREGLRYRNLTLQVSQPAIVHLARRGYHVRYGARPLKRAMERELLLPLAEALNRRSVDDALDVTVSFEDNRLRLLVEDAEGRRGKAALLNELSLTASANKASGLRREWQALTQGMMTRNLQNEIFALERVENNQANKKWKNPEDLARLGRLPLLKGLLSEAKALGENFVRIEEALLLRLYGKPYSQMEGVDSSIDAIETEWKRLLLRLYSLQFPSTDSITLVLHGENPERLVELASAYYHFGVNQGVAPALYQYSTKGVERPLGSRKKKGDAKPRLEGVLIERAEAFFKHPQNDVRCLALGFTFPLAFPLLRLERGFHIFIAERVIARCLVEITEQSPYSYQPPAGSARLGTGGAQERRRTYNQDQSLVEDAVAGSREGWAGWVTSDLIRAWVEKGLMAKARDYLEL